MIAYMNRVPEALQNNPETLVEYAYGISTKYGEAAAALACEMYDAIAEASGAPAAPAIPAEVAEYGDVAKAVYGTRKTGNPETVANSIGRLVKRTGADTTIKNAIRDGAEWAWIPNGDTCAFCLVLASRGWQQASGKTLKGDHAEHIHAHCDCSFQIRFDRNTEYEGYDPDKYLEMYDNAEGKTPEEKINAMRRAQYAKNKDSINKQKREAYEERKERLQDYRSDSIIKTGIKETELLRIPQIPASAISKKIENGEYSLKLSQQNYDKHVIGTFDYERYRRSREKKGYSSQGILTITKEEAQEIINQKSGTGIIKTQQDGTPMDLEWITCDRVIGKYFDKGQFHDTNKAIIYHGKRGSHIVPQKGSHYD